MTEEELYQAAEAAFEAACAVIDAHAPLDVVLAACVASKVADDAYNAEQTFPCSDAMYDLVGLMSTNGYDDDAMRAVSVALDIAE